MRLFILALVFQFLIFSVGCSKNNEEKVLATVGNHKITLEQFQTRYEKFLNSSGLRDNIVNRKKVANYMVNELLLLHYDDNESIFNNIGYIDELEWSRKQVILAYLKDREIYSKINATDAELRTAFKRQNQKLAVSHLYASTKEEADELYKLLQAGVDFEKLAENVFTDSTLKNNGGYLGYFEWGELDPNFEEAAYKLKEGEISEPIETEYGYSIIKLVDRVSKPILTEYEYQNNITQLTRAVRIYKKRPSEKAYINNVVNWDMLEVNQKSLDIIYKNFSIDNTINNFSNDEFTDGECINYKNMTYLTSDIMKRLNSLPVYHREKINSKDRLLTVLKGFVLQDVLLEIAEEKGYTENYEVVERFETMKTNLFMKYKKAEITRNASIEDSTVYNFYKKHLDFFSTHDEMNVAEILVKDEKSALSILEKLKAGGDFGKLAKINSLREFSANNNGIMGYAPRSKFGDLNNTLWNSDINEIIGPIKIENIWGLFKVLDKRESRPIEFEKVKEEAALAAKYFIQKDIFENYVSEFRNESDLIYLDKDLLSSYKKYLASVN
jgi:parvulin-like peptidyl-prolyl isomerase